MIIDQAKLDELKALAAKATPGEWRSGAQETECVFGDVGNPDLLVPAFGRVLLKTNRHHPVFEADAAFIAAANPQVVLFLIAELERLRAELEVVRVIDAWAKKTCRNVPQIERGVRGEEWVMFVTIDGERAWFACKTPAETRAAAAKALLEEDPELDR